MVKTSRRIRQALTKVEVKLYSPLEAISLMQSIASVKFVETAEVHIALNLNPKYADQQLRAHVVLPRGLGKNIKIMVVTKGERVVEALSAGATIAGSEEMIGSIIKGKLDFDKLIVTPDMMPVIAKLGRILGPRGLMPSPKAGTVATSLRESISDFKKGKIEYRIDRTGIIHVPFGKVNFTSEDLLLNLQAIFLSINKNRPTNIKGQFWKTAYIASTMGPSIQLDIAKLI